MRIATQPEPSTQASGTGFAVQTAVEALMRIAGRIRARPSWIDRMPMASVASSHSSPSKGFGGPEPGLT